MLKLVPNILTFGRLVLTIVFLIMILFSPRAQNRPLFLDITFVVFVIAGLTDVVDGPIARRLNVTSKFGRMTDPLVDKILVCGAFVCFAIIKEPNLFDFGLTTMAVIRWSVAAILILREVYVTTLRHVAEARGISFAATISGKVKMFLQSFVIGVVLIKAAHFSMAPGDHWGHTFTAIVFAIMLAVTVISGVRATKRSSWKKAIDG